MSLRVVEPGLFTTVQDLGRAGHQREGVPVGGAMDPLALRVANLLVGNAEDAAGLEMTLVGASLRFEEETLIALAGADLGATLGGEPLAPWRPALARGGTTLSFGGGGTGCRVYLAAAGGVAAPPVLGSRSTFVRARLGGLEGRALRRGDVVPLGSPTPLGSRIAGSLRASRRPVAAWGAGPSLLPAYSHHPEVRLLPGAHQGALAAAARQALTGGEFRVSPESDRTGYRLQGERLQLSAPLELLSEAVAFGTVQLPPDGSPIVLMADRQTTGGYPRIGEAATVDLPLLAQLRPGDRVRFRPCSLAEAHSLLRTRERDLAAMARAISLFHA